MCSRCTLHLILRCFCATILTPYHPQPLGPLTSQIHRAARHNSSQQLLSALEHGSKNPHCSRRQLAAHAHRRSRTTRIEMNAFGSPTRRLVRHLHHTSEQRPSQRPPATCSKKVNRVTFTEFFDDGTMMLKRESSSSCCEFFMRTRAATDERPEPRAKPKSGRRRKFTRCLCGITWNREFMAHGEGESRRSVSACSQPATPPGRVKARGLVGVCAHLSEAVRTRGQGFPGAVALALSALRLTTLAKTQGGASQRPSVLAVPMFVCCCVRQATIVK